MTILEHLLMDERKTKDLIGVLQAFNLRIRECSSYPQWEVVSTYEREKKKANKDLIKKG